MLRRRKNDIEADVILLESDSFAEKPLQGVLLQNSTKAFWKDCFKFVIYCLLLIVPLYAITVSVLKHDWVMVIIDALIVPVGFVHGLLLLFGCVT
jgi:hypothetical protein